MPKEVDYSTETAFSSIVIILLGLSIHPFIITVIILEFPETIRRMVESGYPLRIFAVIFTVITTSWPGLALTLVPSLKWMIGGSIKIQTRGNRLRIVARKDDFETEASCLERVWIEWGGPWNAGGWGGNQLLFWRRYALLIRVKTSGRVRTLAFPLFNVPALKRDELARDLSAWMEKQTP